MSQQNEDMVAQLPHSSKESVVDLLAQCELKLQLLQDELHGKDLSTLMKEMEEEEVRPGSGGCQVHSATGYLEG